MSQESPRRSQPLRHDGRRALDPRQNPPAHGTRARFDEWGMAVGEEGDWLPDFDEMFDLEEEP